MRPYYEEDGITIFHGDCREVLPSLHASEFCDHSWVIVSDPPYGLSAVLGMGGGDKGDGGMWAGAGIAGDEDVRLRDEVLNQLSWPFAVFGSPRRPCPTRTRAIVCWDKGEHTGAGDLSLPWKPSFELVFIGGSGWSWPSRIGGVVRANAVAGCVGNHNNGHRYHPFEKPVEIMAHFIERAPVGLILDPFMGSGTTLRAAKDLGRRAIGIEIVEKYCEIAAKRLSQKVFRFEDQHSTVSGRVSPAQQSTLAAAMEEMPQEVDGPRE